MSKSAEMIERLEYLISGSRVVLNEREKEAVQYGIDAIQSLFRYFELTKTFVYYFNDIQEQTEHVSEILDNSPLTKNLYVRPRVYHKYAKEDDKKDAKHISYCNNCNYYCYYDMDICPKCHSKMEHPLFKEIEKGNLKEGEE